LGYFGVSFAVRTAATGKINLIRANAALPSRIHAAHAHALGSGRAVRRTRGAARGAARGGSDGAAVRAAAARTNKTTRQRPNNNRLRSDVLAELRASRPAAAAGDADADVALAREADDEVEASCALWKRKLEVLERVHAPAQERAEACGVDLTKFYAGLEVSAVFPRLPCVSHRVPAGQTV
jgi:hypothetical protein